MIKKPGVLIGITALILLAAAGAATYGTANHSPPAPLPSAGYTNPVLPGFHPDPAVVRVGRDYYLVNSSCEYFPGIPIYHSRDLINWQIIGHVVTRESQLSLRGLDSSEGIWAPTLRHHNGVFYVVATVWPRGNYLFWANNPAGPWSDAVFIDDGGIDPSLFFDDDGTAYYSRSQDAAIVQAEIDLPAGRLKQTPQPIWSGTGQPHLEGAHLYKINKTYYLLAAEGGTWTDHMVVTARSHSVWGPFESYEHTPILTHRHLPGHPIQATGHADLVQLPDETWWMVFLGGRDVGGYALLGRETFLAPVTWEDGWPVVNNRRPIELEMQPAPALAAAAWPWPFGRDEFEGAALRPAWVFVRGIPAGWSLTSRLGWLALRGGAETLNSRGATPVFVARRMQHLETSLQTRLDFNPQNSTEEAGLALREDEQNHYALVITGQAGSRQVVLRRRVEGKSKEVARRAIGPGIVTLKIKTHPHQFDFYAGLEGENSALIGSLPAEGVKTRAFTGLMVGLYASGNGQPGTTTAYFDWFDYQPQ